MSKTNKKKKNKPWKIIIKRIKGKLTQIKAIKKIINKI